MVERTVYDCDICGSMCVVPIKVSGKHFCGSICEAEFKGRSKELKFESPYAGESVVRDGNGDRIGVLFSGFSDCYTWRQEDGVRLSYKQLKKVLAYLKKLDEKDY